MISEREALSAIRELCDERDRRAEGSVSRTFYGDPFPAMLLTSEIRAILESTDG